MIGLALRSSRANERPSYFMAVDTLPNVALTCDPRPFTAAIIATAIPAAMRPYSMRTGKLLDEREK